MNQPNTTPKNGQFKKGNRAAVGHSSKSQKLRAAILSTISQGDIRDITKKLIEAAKTGDQGAAKLLLGYIGRDPESPVVAVQVNLSDAERRAKTQAIIDRHGTPNQRAERHRAGLPSPGASLAAEVATRIRAERAAAAEDPENR